MNRPTLKRRQSGLSLVELSVAAVILGVAALVLWQFSALQGQQLTVARSAALTERARHALLAYAALHARLPCPARDAGGQEDCTVTSDGYLPFMTLGLPAPDAGQLHYGVSWAAPALTGAAALQVLLPGDGGVPGGLVAQLEPLPPPSLAPGGGVALPQERLLDFCSALGSAAAASASGGSEAVAFFIDGSPSSAFGIAGRLRESMTRAQLMTATGCGALHAAAGRAHFNAALGTAAMVTSLVDYQTQFDLSYGLNEWDVASAQWDLVNASYGLLKTSVKLPIAISAWLSSLSTDPQSASAIAMTTAAFALDVANVVACTENLKRFLDNLHDAQVNRDTTSRLLARTTALAVEVSRNARLNSASPWFLPHQQATPVAPIPPGPPITGAMAGGGALGAAARTYASALGLPVAPDDASPASQVFAGLAAELKACGDDAACRSGVEARLGSAAAAQDALAQAACLAPGSELCRTTVQGIAARHAAR